MAVAGQPFMAAVLLLISLGLFHSSPLPACPEPCTCQRAPLLNCSSSGISVVPQHIRDTVTELDLSHNLIDSVTLDRPLHNLRNVWLGNNSITHLSLCMERNLGGRHVGGRYLHFLRPWSRQGCVSWAPSLQLLSVERNQLEQFPEGLEGSESLQILQLSFNKISTLRPGDLSPLQQLIELHLQHNQISSLHPWMFEGLAQLQVLDLSFNKLTSLHPLMYLSLRNIGADVRLSGNWWHCDCSMRSLRRRLVYDSGRGLQTWSVVCSSPSILSGRDLLQLEEDDLNCFHAENSPELHQDVTVHSGSKVLLTCSAQDTMWLMPGGHASDSQPEAGLLISDFTEKDTGLYVCVSENHEVVSIFNLQISKIEGTKRKTRSLDSQQISESILNRIGQPRNGDSVITQSEFNLAVCLSVFITFLIAFILGVLLRPCIDSLCRRITDKKSSTKTHTVSSVEQRQYDNEAYYEDSVEMGNYRERGIDVSTEDNMQYYDTIAVDQQVNISNDARIRGGAAQAEHTHANGDSSSENSSQHSGPVKGQRDGRERSGRPHNIESKHIPDSVRLEGRRSSSSSSDSSHYDEVYNGKQKTHRDHTTPKSPQLVRDSAQQRADDLTARNVVVPQISIEGSQVPGFSSEPFADWSPHKKNFNLTGPDPWQENGENFEFSDSPRSVSPRSSSVFDSLNDSKQTAKKMRDDTSSSSEDELKDHTANSGEYRNDTQRHTVRPKHSSSSQSSDSDGKNGRIKQDTNKGLEKGNAVHVSDKLNSPIAAGEVDTGKKAVPKPRTKWRLPGLGLGFINRSKSTDTGAPGPSAASPSSSSSESESEVKTKDLQVEQKGGKLSTNPNHPSIPKVKMGLGIKARSPASKSASSDESTDDMAKRSKRKEQKDVDKEKSLAFKAKSPASGSSSSSDSKDDTPNKMKTLKQGETNMARVPTTVSQTKRPTDIKPPSPHLNSSSSSDSEDDTTGRKKMQRPGKVEIKGAPFQGSQTKRPIDIKPASPHSDSSSTSDSEKETPNQMNKHQKETNMARPSTNVTQINRPPNIKPPSPHSDSSSSSSEDETPNQMKTQEQRGTNMARLPAKVPQTVSHGPQTQWPAINLEHNTSIKKRLDFKVKSPASDSSSSSDSEKQTPNQMKKENQRETNIARPPTNVTQINRPPNVKPPSPPSDSSSSSDSEDEKANQMKTQAQRGTNMARPPTKATQINRPPNIKPPSPHSDSSSSSSEDETPNQKTKQGQGKTIMAKGPTVASPTVSHGPQTQWPAINLEHNTSIKKRLDFKVKSPSSDSSSSSDSEDEKANQMKTQEQRGTNMARPPTKATQINRPPNIKPPSPHSDSSSSSSEDETPNQKTKQEQGKTIMAKGPTVASPTVSHGPQTQWPAINLEHNTSIKKRLDFKVKSPSSDSSSSSDSEDEKANQMKTQEQRGTNMARPPTKATQINRPPNIKPPSPHSDSSSSSEDETPNQKTKQEQGKTIMAKGPTVASPTVSHGPQTQWPAINLEHNTSIKKRLDFKVKSPSSDSSSSSDSEKETPNQMKTHEQKEANMARPAKNAAQINRPPNIKSPSPHSDSSSSSDSEDEKESQMKTQQQWGTNIARLPAKVPQTVSHGPQTQWPVINLEHNTSIKKRLDFKVKTQASDSSSSSDSEKETQNQMKTQQQREMNMARPPTNATQVNRPPNIKPPSPHSDSSSSSSDSEKEITRNTEKQSSGKVAITGLPIQGSKIQSPGSHSMWPAIDLGHTLGIKRRLDFKITSQASDSSSSSDSEQETPNQMKTQQQRETNMARPSTNVTQINRLPNIKPPSPPSDSSSSSSDSEDEKENQMKTQQQWGTNIARLPAKVPQTVSHGPQTQWPVINLEHNTSIKKRLDFKVKSPASDSSSSSDSEKEIPNQIKTQQQREKNIAKFPTNVTQIRRPPDNKPPSPHFDSSSSSDSENEKPNQIKKPQQGESNMARLPTKLSQIKRPLDNKPTAPHSDSSSSSDSEDEQKNHTRRESSQMVKVAGPLFQKSPTGSHVSKTQWPAVDLGNIIRIKRRLDFKALSPPLYSSSVGGMIHTVEVKREKATKNSSSSSSSSSDEQEEAKKDLNKPSTTVEPNLGSRWPQVNLGSVPRVNRRLDIRAPSPPPGSSSSSSESEGGTTDLSLKAAGDRANFGVTSYQPKIKLPDLNLSNRTKRESSVSPGSKQSESNSSGSDSEAENRDRDKQGLGSPTISRPMTTQFISSLKTPNTVIHTNQDIKLEKYTVYTDDGDQKLVENFKSTTVVSPELESRWAKMNLSMSRFRKRLEITPRAPKSPSLPSSPTSPTSPLSPSSPKPDSSSSSSSDEDTESKGRKTSYRRKETESSQILENKPGNVSLTGNSVEVKRSIRTDYGFPVTEVKSNPNTTLTGFGTSNLRRHLDMKVSEKAPATPPLQQMSDSSSSSEDEDSSKQHPGKGWQGRSQLPVVPDNKASQIHTSLHVAKAVNIKTDYSQRQTEAEERKAKVELKSQTLRVGGQSDSLKSHMSLTGLSLQRKASSSSSEDEMTGHRVSDLKLGGPSNRKGLNTKEPSTSSSSSSTSSSEDEGHAAKQSRHAADMTDESVTTYKRSIFKTSSTPSVYYPHNGPTTGLTYRRAGAELVTVAQGGPSQSVRGSNTSPASRSMSFDDVARKKINQSQHTTDVGLPPDIRWTGIGRHLSDISVSSQRRYLDVGLSTLPAEPDLPKVYSSNYSAGKSDSTIKQDRSTLAYKYSSPGDKSVSPASTRAFDQFDFSRGSTNLEAVHEDKREMRGLSALKAMSSERRMWDTPDGNLVNSAPLIDVHGPQVTTSYNYRRSEDIKPLAKQSLTPLHLSSTSVDERRGTNLSYGVPYYRRHELGSTVPMQRSPPPIPNMPLPDEAEGLTWRSLQSTRSFDSSNPNISSV